MESNQESIRKICWKLIELNLNDEVLPIKNKRAIKNTLNGKTIYLMVMKQDWNRFDDVLELENKNGFLFIATCRPNKTFSLYKVRLEEALNCDWSRYKVGQTNIRLNKEDIANNSNILRVGDNSRHEYMKMEKVYELTSF